MSLQHVSYRNIAEIIPHLEQNQLHTSDLSEKIQFYKWSMNGITGYAGVEIKNKAALLRSVVIEKEKQKSGAGTRLVLAVLDELKKMGIAEVYLLTLTAEGFFKKIGFSTISKSQVPESISETEEFSTICPYNAVCMVKNLK